MNYVKTLAVAVIAICAACPLFADISATSEPFTFSVRTSNGAFAMNSSELPAWPVTYRAGESVTLVAPSGASTTLADGAAAGAPDLSGVPLGEDGVWALRNSNGRTALLGVTWGTNGGSLTTSDSESGIALFTVGGGPDRKLKRSETPPVAYSGDDWAGDLSKAATLTFTPPSGGEAQTPTLDPAGTGVKSFTFSKSGDWTVTLTFADGTTKTATVTIQDAGFTLIVR